MTSTLSGPFIDPIEDILVQWLSVTSDFSQRMAEWEEEELDSYKVPHPLIGMLTLREMAMFSIYHCRHHFEEIKTILAL